MKRILPLAAALLFSLANAALAESKATLENVHLCCKACVTGVTKAVGKVSGATATCDMKAGKVELSAADAATVQKAVDAIVAAGYFGTSADGAIVVKDTSGAKDAKVSSLKVNGVHLCCGKCVSAVDDAVKSVKGVTGHTAEKNSKSFTVTGDFNAKELFDALHRSGFAGKAGN
jgi:copper chaperone CopZ